jgi:hypothetical protein
MKWRPIKTAPKDGTWILVCKATDADGDPISEDAFGLFVHRAAWWAGDNAWIVYNSMVCDPECFFEPTHWMPISKGPR